MACASPSSSSYAPFYDIRSQITSFSFGNSVQTIPAYLCASISNLTSVVLPGSILSIGDDFMLSSGITTIRSEAINPPDWQNLIGAVLGISVTVPCGRVLAYKGATPVWSRFSKYYTFGDFPFTLTLSTQTEGTGSVAVTTALDCSTNTGKRSLS